MIKKFIILLLMMVLGSGIFGYSMGNQPAEAMGAEVVEKYYTSILIKQGDSLWSIAGKYREHSGLTVEQYVKELKNMNGLKEDVIHSGHYLTVMYFTPGENP